MNQEPVRIYSQDEEGGDDRHQVSQVLMERSTL